MQQFNHPHPLPTEQISDVGKAFNEGLANGRQLGFEHALLITIVVLALCVFALWRLIRFLR